MSSFNNALQGADMDCFQMTCWWTVTDRAARHYVDKSASAFLWIHEFHPSNQISCFERQKWQTKPQLKLPEGRWRLSQRESGQLEIFHAKHVSGSPKKRSKWFTGCSKHNFLFVAEDLKKICFPLIRYLEGLLRQASHSLIVHCPMMHCFVSQTTDTEPNFRAEQFSDISGQPHNLKVVI